MTEMSYPVVDHGIWLRMVIAWCVVVLAPGYLLAGRHVQGSGPTGGERRLLVFILSAGCGLLVAPLLAPALSLLGPGWRPWFYLPVVVALSWVLGKLSWWRSLLASTVEITSAATDDESRQQIWPLVLVGAACLAMALLLLTAYADVVVPRGDGANHAFMARRIAETGSVLGRNVFAAPHGKPDFVYLMGWHAVAAQIAQVGQLPAYMAVWLLPLLNLCLLPASAYLLWRTIGLRPAVCCLAAWLLLVNARFPTGVLGWGGFGHPIGWFLVPVVVVLIRSVASAGSWRGGLAVGCMLVAMMQIHATELVSVLLLSAVVLHGIKRNVHLTSQVVQNPAFGVTDARHAVRLSEVLPADAHVANIRRDGSRWAWHLSGLLFLQPCTWYFHAGDEANRQQATLGFTEAVWPVETRALHDRGVTHLYVSDTLDGQFLRQTDTPYTRAHFDRDPRFERVLESENSSVYRVLWGEAVR